MIRSILPATLLSSLVISGVWAAPSSPNALNEFSSSTLVHVGYYDKKYNKIRNTINTMVITTTNRDTIKAADIIMAADIGVTVTMPVPPVGKP